MKKLLSLAVLLVSLIAIFTFTASAQSEITGAALGKHAYGTAVLKWFVNEIENDYYFNIYLDGEKITPKQAYNGRHYYCYVDEIYPGETHKYKVEYYVRNLFGGYNLVDEIEKNMTVEDYFIGYGYGFTGVSKSRDSVNLQWDYRTGYLDEIVDPVTDDSLLKFNKYYFEVYYFENGIWKKALETSEEKATITGLKENTSYKFMIKAFCKSKETDEDFLIDESEVIEVKTMTEYMENFRIEEFSDERVLLKWDIDVDQLVSSGIYTDEYYFDIYMQKNYNITEKIGTTYECEFEFDDLEEFTNYTVYVVLISTRTNGIDEEVESTKHLDFDTIINYFGKTEVSSVKATTAEISWSFDEKAYAENKKIKYNSDDFIYYVYYVEDGKANRIGSTKKQSYSLDNLYSDTVYNIRVAVYHNDKNSGKKRIDAIDFDEFTTKLDAPEKIVISYTPKTKVATIKWSAVDGAAGYILYRYNYDIKEYERIEKQKGRSYTFNYADGEKYRFYVKSYKSVEGKDTAGDGISSTFVTTKKVTVSADVNNVKPGKKLTLKAVLSPSNSTDTIKWTTSNSDVATVSSKGVVKGIKNGKAVITATASSGKKTTFTVIVTDASISKTSAAITTGKTYTLKINNYSDKITWSTSNKKVATVSSKGVVKGISAGDTVITAKLKNGAVFTCKIKVTKAK